MNGRDGTTAFLSLDSKIGGQESQERPNIGQFLTREQANHVYKKVETGKMMNPDAIQQEIEQEEQSAPPFQWKKHCTCTGELPGFACTYSSIPAN